MSLFCFSAFFALFLREFSRALVSLNKSFSFLLTLKRQIYTRFGEKSNNFQFIEPPVNWDLSGEAQLSRSIKNTFPPMNKREVLKKKMDLEFSINRAGMRAIKAALEFEKCFDSNLVNREPNIEFGDGDSQNKNNKENKKSSLLESAFEVATKKNLQPSLNFFNDSEKRAYLLRLMLAKMSKWVQHIDPLLTSFCLFFSDEGYH